MNDSSLSKTEGSEDATRRPSGSAELLRISVGIAVFALIGPFILGAILFFGAIATAVIGNAIDSLHLGQRFDPSTAIVVVTGLMLVMLNFGWPVLYGMLLLPSAASGAAIALRHAIAGPAGWRYAIATGLAVGLVADIGVVGFGWPIVGGTRIGIFAGWVVLGSLTATLACWRVASLAAAPAHAR